MWGEAHGGEIWKVLHDGRSPGSSCLLVQGLSTDTNCWARMHGTQHRDSGPREPEKDGRVIEGPETGSYRCWLQGHGMWQPKAESYSTIILEWLTSRENLILPTPKASGLGAQALEVSQGGDSTRTKTASTKTVEAGITQRQKEVQTIHCPHFLRALDTRTHVSTKVWTWQTIEKQ